MSILAALDTMSCQERMQALIRSETPDRVPFSPMALGFAAKTAGMDLGQFYRYPEKAYQAGLGLMTAYPWMNTRPTYGWAERGAWEFGGDIIWPDGDRYPAPISPHPVISKPEQIEDLEIPDPLTAGMNPLIARFNQLSRSHGFPASLPAERLPPSPLVFSGPVIFSDGHCDTLRRSTSCSERRPTS